MSDWRHRAACAGYATDWWYADRLLEQGYAKDICATCDVAADCLNDAITRGEKDGIWGGLTPTERETLRRRKPELGTRERDIRRKAAFRAATPARTCPSCGHDYQPNRPKQKYCTRECSARGNQNPGGRKRTKENAA